MQYRCLYDTVSLWNNIALNQPIRLLFICIDHHIDIYRYQRRAAATTATSNYNLIESHNFQARQINSIMSSKEALFATILLTSKTAASPFDLVRLRRLGHSRHIIVISWRIIRWRNRSWRRRRDHRFSSLFLQRGGEHRMVVKTAHRRLLLCLVVFVLKIDFMSGIDYNGLKDAVM